MLARGLLPMTSSRGCGSQPSGERGIDKLYSNQSGGAPRERTYTAAMRLKRENRAAGNFNAETRKACLVNGGKGSWRSDGLPSRCCGEKRQRVLAGGVKSTLRRSWELTLASSSWDQQTI